MSVLPSINSQKILRSKIRLLGDEQVDELEQPPPVDTKTEAEGQPSSLRRGGGR